MDRRPPDGQELGKDFIALKNQNMKNCKHPFITVYVVTYLIVYLISKDIVFVFWRQKRHKLDNSIEIVVFHP